MDLEKFLEKLRKVDYDEQDMSETDSQDIDIDDIAEEVERIIDIVPTQTTKISARKESKESIRETMARLGALGKTYQESFNFFRDVKLSEDKETLCLLFSDWHFGKVIKKPGGEVLFNSDIAFKRVSEHFVPQIIKIIKDLGRADRIEDIRMLFVGDIVDNDIVYNTQRLHIDKPVASQFHDVCRAIMILIGSIRTAFTELGIKDIPILIEGVPGNHGRGSEISDDGECSWDTSIAALLTNL